MATLSRSDVEHVAYLARLGLTDDELTRLEGQLNHILDQYAILAELDTDDIPPTAQTIELENILREDVARPSLPSRPSSANAPGARRRLHRRPGRSSTSATEPMPGPADLTRLHAHEHGRPAAGRRAVVARADRGAPRRRRARQPGAQRLAHDRPRAGAGRGRRRRRPARRRPRRRAHALDALHPLLGIPVALKDLVSVAGGQCTAGSRILEGYRAPYDAHITERLRDAGRGDPRQDEHGRVRDGLVDRALGLRPDGQPVGPRPRARAAAAAARRRPSPPSTRRSSIGTDTGGSIRQPAALSGIVGMKPTYGRVSRYGIVAFASSLDQIGPFARDARDAAALLHAVAGRDERDSTSSPEPVPDDAAALPADDDEAAAALRGKRLGLPREYFVAGHGAGRRGARPRGGRGARGGRGDRRGGQPAAHRLRPGDVLHRRAGRGVGEPRPLRRHPLRPAARRRRRARQLPRDARRGFGAEVKRRIMLGTYALSAGYYDAYYLKAQKVRTLIKGDFDALWAQGFDALVAPTSPTVAFRFGARMADPVAMYLSDACTLPVNMAGLPGDLDPVRAVEGLPVGLQLIGAAVVRGRAVRACARPTRRSPRAPTGARSSPPSSPRRRIRRRRRRSSEWRPAQPDPGRHGRREPRGRNSAPYHVSATEWPRRNLVGLRGPARARGPGGAWRS